VADSVVEFAIKPVHRFNTGGLYITTACVEGLEPDEGKILSAN
jgi:hypothetical protein